MKYIVKLDRDEMLDVLSALQVHADVLEQTASLNPDESRRQHLLQKSRKQIDLYRKILDTCKRID